MKKIILLLLLFTATKSFSQIDWSNYSTSFKENNGQSIGVAVPYNGISNNMETRVVGYAHWNPQLKIKIDSSINDQAPLTFVYDESDVYFLAPGVNRKNSSEFEYSVLLNNTTVVASWKQIEAFTREEVGSMGIGSGIVGGFYANLGNYLVFNLKNKRGNKIASWVVYWKKAAPEIKSIFTSNNPEEFSKIAFNEDRFSQGSEEIGWHREYYRKFSGKNTILKLPYDENNILINIDEEIYKKEALEYSVIKNGKELQLWKPNNYNNNHILLKNLEPGEYVVQIRLKRQPQSILQLKLTITPAWYQTAIFKIACFVFVGLLFGLFFLLYRYRKQQKNLIRTSGELEDVSTTLRAIHTQLNPHFTFNALNSIQSLINKNETDNANKYLSIFSSLLRETLNESKQDLIPLKKELDNLKSYIELEQLRLSFNYTLNINETINPLLMQVPPFILQPFVENSIKHGFDTNLNNCVLSIDIKKENTNLVIEIKDNGRGFNVTSFKEGHGLFLSKKRIETLNKQYGEELIQLNDE